MSIKHLTGAYPGGYTLSAAYTGLVIENSASVGGAGVSVSFAATIWNYGVVSAEGYNSGIRLTGGGDVVNGSEEDRTATIGSWGGVRVSGGYANITNYGTIASFHTLSGTGIGVYIGDGGTLTNGSVSDTSALIEGFDGVSSYKLPVTISNFGTISVAYARAVSISVYLYKGGRVTNGSDNDAVATLNSYYAGIYSLASCTITNNGYPLHSPSYG